MRPIAALVVPALATAILQGQQIWIVAPSGGHFTDPAAAFAAAAPGDTVILRGGVVYAIPSCS